MKVRFADLPKKEVLFSSLGIGEMFVFRAKEREQILGIKISQTDFIMLAEDKRPRTIPNATWLVLQPREVEITIIL